MNYSIYTPVKVCEVCGKPKHVPGIKGLHDICSKTKQKRADFKEEKITPSRQRRLARGYEFLLQKMNQQSQGASL